MHIIHYKKKFNYTPDINEYVVQYGSSCDEINIGDNDTDIIKPNTKEIYIKRKRAYYYIVRKLTLLVNKENIDGYDTVNLLSKEDTVSGISVFKTSNKLVIDHKISIIYGFKNNIPAEHISSISNLRYISSHLNHKKCASNYIDNLNEWILHTAPSSN